MNLLYIQTKQTKHFKSEDVESLKTLNSLAPFAHSIKCHMKILPYLLVGLCPLKTCKNWSNNITIIEGGLIVIPYVGKKMLSLGNIEDYKSLWVHEISKSSIKTYKKFLFYPKFQHSFMHTCSTKVQVISKSLFMHVASTSFEIKISKLFYFRMLV
jgi:hypothetical protein